MYIKATLNDDELYVEADSIEDAANHLRHVFAKNNHDIRVEAIKFEVLEDLPEGQIPLTFEEKPASDGSVPTKDTYI
jgi:hypothetical protein